MKITQMNHSDDRLLIQFTRFFLLFMVVIVFQSLYVQDIAISSYRKTEKRTTRSRGVQEGRCSDETVKGLEDHDSGNINYKIKERYCIVGALLALITLIKIRYQQYIRKIIGVIYDRFLVERLRYLFHSKGEVPLLC